MFETKLEQYTGPLDKLLELIEAEQLEITSLSLSVVTLDFLNFLKEKGGEVAPDMLSDFLVVAAKLVLIKSKTLIPELTLKEDEEHDMRDLEMRLKLYKEFAARGGGKAAVITRMWHTNPILISRSFMATMTEGGYFYPGANLSLDSLRDVVRKLIHDLRVIVPEARTVAKAIIRLEDKIEELLLRCKIATEHAFSSFSKDKPRSEVIVFFLALLHLLKSKSISVRQEGAFGDILVKRLESDGKQLVTNDQQRPTTDQ